MPEADESRLTRHEICGDEAAAVRESRPHGRTTR